jgi:hypothetical protein
MTTELHLVVTNIDTDDEAVLLATLDAALAVRQAAQPWDLEPGTTGYRERGPGDVDAAVLTVPLESTPELEELAYAAGVIAVVTANPNALTSDKALEDGMARAYAFLEAGAFDVPYSTDDGTLPPLPPLPPPPPRSDVDPDAPPFP